MTWRPEPTGSHAAVRPRRARSGEDAALSVGPLLEQPRPRGHRLVAAARVTLAAAVFCLVALVAVLVTEPGLLEAEPRQLPSELQVLERPIPYAVALPGVDPADPPSRGPAVEPLR